MSYILGLVVVGFFFLALHNFTELNKSQKITISVVFFLVLSGAIAFNTYSDSKSDKMLDVVRKFKQNKTIKCSDIDVNQTNFTLSIGTYTFIGKENTPYYNQMISASQCK